jgi:hypothetical protein
MWGKALQAILWKRISFSCSIYLSRSIPISSQATRLLASQFHNSSVLLAKGGKAKGGKGKDLDDGRVVELPNLKDFQVTLSKSVTWLKAEFDKNKLGQVSPDFFQNLNVPGYGNLNKVAQVSISMGANAALTVTVYDPALVKPVQDSIQGCGLKLTPAVEGVKITAKLPRPTKESRELMLKALSQLAEKVR